MAKSYASAVIPASVDEVWAVVREFDGLPKWHPGIAGSEIEGGGPELVGCVRVLTLGDGATVRERLTEIDDVDRRTSYQMLDGPFPIRSYLATIRLAPVTESGHTFAQWFAHYDADAADEADLDRTFAGAVFAGGLKGLRKQFPG